MAHRMCVTIGFVALTFVEAVTYGNNRVPVRRDNPLIEANFQNVSEQLLSPAFLSPQTIPIGFFDGSSGPTDDNDLDLFLRSVAEQNEWATYSTLDFKSEDGRSFPTLRLSTSPRDHVVNATQKKLRVWIQGAAHGNEPAGDQAILALVGKLNAKQAWTASLLKNMDIFILPRYNPDGVAHFQRTLLTNFDPNRDHIKLASQQTRDIKHVFNGFAPHVAVDMHEYGAATYYNEYQQAADGLYSAAKNLNIHASIRRMSETLFAPAVGALMESRGLRWEPYVTVSPNWKQNTTINFVEASSDGKIGRNAFGLTQCIAFLIETRGIGIANQEFQRRTAASLTMVEALIQTAADNAQSVYATVENAIAEFQASDDDIIITDSPVPVSRTFTMVKSQTGRLEAVPIRYQSTTPTRVNLTRPRPEAYLIPRPWTELAQRLRDSGLEVTQLDHNFDGTVEVLTIKTAAFDTTFYEGVVPLKVTTVSSTKRIELEKGAYWISTRQKNAGLAFVALEPENIDSYVSFNIVPVAEGDDYPIFRILG